MHLSCSCTPRISLFRPDSRSVVHIASTVEAARRWQHVDMCHCPLTLVSASYAGPDWIYSDHSDPHDVADFVSYLGSGQEGPVRSLAAAERASGRRPPRLQPASMSASLSAAFGEPQPSAPPACQRHPQQQAPPVAAHKPSQLPQQQRQRRQRQRQVQRRGQ